MTPAEIAAADARAEAAERRRRARDNAARRLRWATDPEWRALELARRARQKRAQRVSDPSFRALGNSMAVPCMAWIGKRIAMVDAVREVL